MRREKALHAALVRGCLIGFFIVSFAAAQTTAPAPTSDGAGKRLNIVLMVTDDQGLQSGCYGDPTVKTPNLDRLAAEGTRFTSAFCTTSSCSPSRSVILTGLYNHANGQYGLQHDVHNFGAHARIRGLPVLLHEAGYETCSMGKFHVQPEPVFHFDSYGPKGNARSSRLAANAREYLGRPHDKPFFLYLCTTDPHRAGKGFANDQRREKNTARYDASTLPVPAWLPDNPAVRGDLAEYYEATSRADRSLGQVLEAIRDTGHLDDTVVIFLSDNGPPFPGAKTSLYEPGIHLPLVIRMPAASRRGVACEALVTWADITPTLLDIAGVKAPYPLHGRSVVPVLEQTKPDGWDEVYLSHTFHEVTMYYPMRAIRTRRYKLILNLAHELSAPFASDLYESPTWQSVLSSHATMLGGRSTEAFLHRPRWELYDLEKDPLETQNLADEPSLRSVREELAGKLRAWQEKTKDPWRIKYVHE